jgi:chromosome segregation ATPase
MQKLLLLVLACATLAGTVLWRRAENRYEQALRRIAGLEAMQGATPQPATPAPPAPAPAAPAAETRIVRVPVHADSAEYIRIIEDLRSRAAAFDRDLAAAREEATNAAALAETESAGRVKLSAQVESLQDDLQAARRISAALEAELRAKSERLARAETERDLAARKAGGVAPSAGRAGAATREIEDLNRRRETLVASLQRRYRDVTDTYRAFSLNLQHREQGGAAIQAGDLSRIQNSIQQAEDELRQLQGLNSRLAQLARDR